MTKSGSDCCKPPLKTREEDQEEEVVNVSLTAAKEFSVDAVAAFYLNGMTGLHEKKNKEQH